MENEEKQIFVLSKSAAVTQNVEISKRLPEPLLLQSTCWKIPNPKLVWIHPSEHESMCESSAMQQQHRKSRAVSEKSYLTLLKKTEKTDAVFLAKCARIITKKLDVFKVESCGKKNHRTLCSPMKVVARCWNALNVSTSTKANTLVVCCSGAFRIL